VHPIGADFEIVFQSILLPCDPPVGRDAPNVEVETLAVRRLRRADVG
jgi:hypothetical protein